MNEISLGMIGYGNMAQAITAGLLLSKAVSEKQIFACAGNYDKLCENAKKSGIVPCRSAAEVIGNSDFIILAVKPDRKSVV